MCGIAVLAVGNESRDRVPYPILRKLMRELLLELQVRGQDASGIAVLNRPGGEDSKVFKMPLRPTRLVVRPRFEEMLDRIGPDTDFVLLHARATTAGSNAENFDNHPIITPGCIGIHNGTLKNYLALFDQFKHSFGRTGKVDSEVIFRLYKHFARNMGPKEAIQEVSKYLSGSFTGALMDWNHPRRLVMFKFERSLSMIKLPAFDLVLFISEPKFFQNAAKKLDISVKTTSDYIHDATGLVVDLNSGDKVVNSVTDFKLPMHHGLPAQKEVNPWTRINQK